MHRPLHILAVASLTAAALHAQCLTVSGAPVTLTPTTTFYPADDEGLSAPLPLGFAFPLGANTYTHVSIESNGVIYLTNGGAPVGITGYGYQDMAGVAGDSPRLAVYWADLEGVSAGWGVLMDTSVAGEAKITWVNVNEYTQPSQFTVQAVLHSSGQFDVTLPAGLSPLNYQVTCGLSAGNGLLGSSSDLSTSPVSAIASLYEDFFNPTPIDISNHTTTLLPAGTGYLAVNTCSGPPPASHTSYGAGCYNLPGESVYQQFGDAGLASTGLTGNAMSLLVNGSGYTAIWLPGTAGALYVAPTGAATALAPNDDGDDLVNLPSALPVPGGTVTQVTVSHNGIITLGSTGNNQFDYTPSGPELASATGAAFYSWHDWNDQEVGSGALKTELVGNLFCITWDNVESYASPEGPNQGTQQFQLNLTTGAVTYVWTNINSNVTSIFGSAYVVGYKGNGVTADGGSVNLGTTLPGTYRHVPLLPMTLAASPAPASTPIAGTVVTYTTSSIPEYAPSTGVYIALNILSVGQVPAPGLDLGIIGAPGCAALVQSLDYTQAMVGFTNSQSVTFSIPPGVPVGLTIYSQSAAMILPNSLPNGQNAFGLTTSNGIASFISLQ
jgi:hypothetical protein